MATGPRNFDPTPYWRALPQAQENYPPYNIVRIDEDNYRISIAVAGFMPEEISITAEQNQLTVEGQKRGQPTWQYLYQGISARAFRRQFNLADYVKVKGASFEHGLLEIDLVREVPEAMSRGASRSPRALAIGGRATPRCSRTRPPTPEAAGSSS